MKYVLKKKLLCYILGLYLLSSVPKTSQKEHLKLKFGYIRQSHSFNFTTVTYNIVLQRTRILFHDLLFSQADCKS